MRFEKMNTVYKTFDFLVPSLDALVLLQKREQLKKILIWYYRAFHVSL